MSSKILLLFIVLTCLGNVKTQAQTPKENTTNTTVAKSNDDEATQLIKSLSKDKLVNEFEGFVVEKKQNNLFINGKQQSAVIAGKYLASLKQETIRVEVFPFKERFMQHPNSNILQLLTPVLFSSPCIKKTTKDGC